MMDAGLIPCPITSKNAFAVAILLASPRGLLICRVLLMQEVSEGVEVQDHHAILMRLLNSCTNTKPQGAELGVASGRLAHFILKKCKHVDWLMVDRRDKSRQLTMEKTEFAGARRQFIVCDSAPAAKQYDGPQLDLCFVDGDHTYHGVRNDLEAWYPLMRPGGCFCGHDVDSVKDRIGKYGVRRAVNEFFVGRGAWFSVLGNVWIHFKDINISSFKQNVGHPQIVAVGMHDMDWAWNTEGKQALLFGQRHFSWMSYEGPYEQEQTSWVVDLWTGKRCVVNNSNIMVISPKF